MTRTRRKPSTASAQNGRRRSNPRRRSTALVPARRRRRTALQSAPNRRRRNPTHIRRRRRNPQVKSLVTGALWAGAGAAATNFVSGFIPFGGGGWMDVVKQGAAAYAVGFLAERFTSPANAQLMAIGGFAGAAWSAVNMLLSGASGFLTPHPQPAHADPQVGDIMPHPGLYGLEGFGDVMPAPAFYPQNAQGY